jgi:MFS family permease
MVGVYLAVTAVTNLGANLFFGRLSRRIDNRAVLGFAILAGLVMSASVLALALLAKPLHISPGLASAWLLPVFFLSAVRGTGAGIANNSLLLDVAPLDGRSVCLGFSNTFQGLVLLSTGLSGVIMGWVGFKALVTITLLAHLLALLAVRGFYLPKDASQPSPSAV